MTDINHYTKWHKFMEFVENNMSPTYYERQPISYKHFTENMNELKKIGPIIPIFQITVPESDADKNLDYIPDEFTLMMSKLKRIPRPFDDFVIEMKLENDDEYPMVLFVKYHFMNETKFECERYVYIDGFAYHRPSKDADDLDMWSACYGLSKLCVQLSTKGFEQSVIEPPSKLNDNRVKKGKPPIPPFTVIKIGHYYNSSGERQEYDERNPVKVHWRRGHIRGVWCGVGDERHLEDRYINPCLVNYQAGDEPPEQQLRVLQ